MSGPLSKFGSTLHRLELTRTEDRPAVVGVRGWVVTRQQQPPGRDVPHPLPTTSMGRSAGSCSLFFEMNTTPKSKPISTIGNISAPDLPRGDINIPSEDLVLPAVPLRLATASAHNEALRQW